MASTTIHSLAYKITADTSAFTNGMKTTRAEMNAAKKLTQEFQSPLEKHAQATDKITTLLQKEAISLDTYSRAMAKANKELIAAERAEKNLGKAIESNATKNKAQKSYSLGGVASSVGIGLGGVFSAGYVMSKLKSATEELDAQQDAARRLNIETDDYIRLQYGLRKVAELSNDEVENFLSTMRSNTALASRDMGRAKKLFEELGYSAEQLTSLSMQPLNKQFEILVGEINKIDNASSRALIVEKIFGTNASSVMEYIDGGVAGIRSLGDEIERIGGLQGDSAEKITAAVEASKSAAEAWNIAWQQLAIATSPLNQAASSFSKEAASGMARFTSGEATKTDLARSALTAAFYGAGSMLPGGVDAKSHSQYRDFLAGVDTMNTTGPFSAEQASIISQYQQRRTEMGYGGSLTDVERRRLQMQADTLAATMQMLDELKKQGRILEDNAR